MTARDWLSRTTSWVQEDGVSGLRRSAYELYLGIWRRIGRVYNYGTPIFETEWDLLIVLDACRADLLFEVADEYEFLSDAQSTYSVGSATAEWMSKTFVDRYAEEMAQTAYVTANPHSSSDLDERDFVLLDEVWQYAWSDDLGTVPPRPVTDRAIQIGREFEPSRMVVHYMQPHHPFVPSPELNRDIGFDDEAEWNHVWEMLQAGATTREEVWQGYRENLEYVLDDIAVLLQNVDAERVVITADHANAFGEWGIYGHPKYVPLAAVKEVPWFVTSARDAQTYQPSMEGQETDEPSQEVVTDRLRDLGYM